jgi:4-aminobutyrate aminotransferase/(S)-3-amino-2-methylpropionate transaminase
VVSVGNTAPRVVENAIKVARAATGKPSIVAFDHAYHGRTNLTMALTAKSKPKGSPAACRWRV